MGETPVDPRVERSRAVILDAALDELAALGYGAMTIEGVARRAGVSKATLYRQWDGKLDLVGDAVALLKQRVQPDTDGDVRTRIVSLLRSLAELCGSSRFSSCMPAIVGAAEHDEAVREFHHRTSAERRAVLVGMLDEAVGLGRLDADADTALLAELLVGPLFLRRLMSPTAFPPADVERVVSTVLDPYWHADRPDRDSS